MESINCTIVAQAYNSNAFGTSTCYAGFNYSDWYTYRLQFTTPAFTGKSSAITFNIQWRSPNVNGSTAKTFSLRWALMTSDDQLAKYRGHANEVADDTDRLETGRVDLSVPSDYSTASLTIATDGLKPNTTYYLYMWGDGSTGKSQNYSRATPPTNHTVVLEYDPICDLVFRHYLCNEAGRTLYSTDSMAVEAGSSHVPATITPPESHTASGAVFFAYGSKSGVNFGGGIADVNSFDANESAVVEINYPLAPGSIVVNVDGELWLADVYYKE